MVTLRLPLQGVPIALLQTRSYGLEKSREIYGTITDTFVLEKSVLG
jgi:hypothetical protein